MIKKILKRIGQGLLLLIVVANLLILLTGRTYIYKGLVNTYFAGVSHPQIDEHEIFDNREVSTSSPQAWELHQKYNQLVLSDSAAARHERVRSVGFVVVQDGKLLHEQYWGGFDENSITNSFSVAKSIVSLLVGVAVSEGKMKLSDPISTYLPEYAGIEKGDITIENLLTMSSGLDWSESRGNPFSHNAEAYYGSDLKELLNGIGMSGEAPGSTFRYQSGNTQLVGFALENATGEKLSDYAAKKLWGPIGAEHPALWNLDDEGGHEKAYCCFYATAKDFARVGQLVLNDGYWGTKSVVRSDYIEAMVSSNGLPDARGDEYANDKYGYFWWRKTIDGHQMWYARGLYGQYIIVFPGLNVVAVRTGHDRLPKSDGDHPEDLFYWAEAALELTGN